MLVQELPTAHAHHDMPRKKKHHTMTDTRRMPDLKIIYVGFFRTETMSMTAAAYRALGYVAHSTWPDLLGPLDIASSFAKALVAGVPRNKSSRRPARVGGVVAVVQGRRVFRRRPRPRRRGWSGVSRA